MAEIKYKDKYEDINTNSMRIITKMLDDASEKNYVKIFRAKELLTYNEKHLFSEKVLNELLNDVNTELSKFDNTMFGYYLCSVRVKNKQTIKQAAKKMGITEGALRIYEAGEAYPSYSVVMILKNTYKISDDEILEAIERDEKTNILYWNDIVEDGRYKMASFLKGYRIANNYKVVDLVKLSGDKLTQAYITNSENGKRIVTPTKFGQYAKLYGKTYKEFLELLKSKEKGSKISHEIPRLIKNARLKKKMTTSELAELAELPHTFICGIEDGTRYFKTKKSIDKLAEVLDIDGDHILKLVNEEYQGYQKKSIESEITRYSCISSVNNMFDSIVGYKKYQTGNGTLIDAKPFFAIMQALLTSKGSSKSAKDLYCKLIETNDFYETDENLKYRKWMDNEKDVDTLSQIMKKAHMATKNNIEYNCSLTQVSQPYYSNMMKYRQQYPSYEMFEKLKKVLDIDPTYMLILRNERKAADRNILGDTLTENELLERVNQVRGWKLNNQVIENINMKHMLVELGKLSKKGFTQSLKFIGDEKWYKLTK